MELNLGKSDKKQYRLVTLANGLECLLIHEETRAEEDDESATGSGSESGSDGGSESGNGSESGSGSDGDDDDDGARTQRAACAVVVGVGSWADPAGTPGAAHFLEHLLFLGSAKYPAENQYDGFLSKHGGSSNAQTDVEHTSYYFDVLPGAFREALDVFAQFFVEPTFAPGMVAREVKAIDNEFNETKRDDAARLDELMYVAGAEQGHPFATFTWGHAESLRHGDASAVQAVKDLYRDHYHASNMKLCLVAPASLDETEAWCRASFDKVKASPATMPAGRWRRTSWDAPPAPLKAPFSDGASALCRVAPARDAARDLRLVWPLPGVRGKWRTRPGDLAAHCLGHEGPTSALAQLRRSGLASGLVAGISGDGVSDSVACGALFAVSVDLTEAGVARWAEVVGCVFAHARACLAALSGDALARLSTELQTVERLNFDFEEEGEVDDLVEGLAALMLPADGVERKHLLEVAGGVLLAPFDADAMDVLRVLADPAQCRVELSTAAFRSADAKPEAPCAPSCPRCNGRGGFHAALAKLMPSLPPPPPASGDIPAKWAPFAGLATRRPDEPPQVEARFGTEHWTNTPAPSNLIEAWRACDDWPALGLPAPNTFVVKSPTLKPGSARARPVPTAGEVSEAATAEEACKAFADALRRRAGGPAKKRKKGKPSAADVALAKLVEGFPGAPDATDAAPARVGDVWVLARPDRFELPTLYVRARLTGAAAPTAKDAVLLQLAAALIADDISEDLYPATVAGLDYTIAAVLDADALALSLKCGGFDEKVPALFQALLQGVRRAADTALEPRAFAAAKSEVTLSLENAWHDADSHARRLRLCCLAPGRRFSPAQRLAALQNVDAATCQRWLRNFLGGCSRAALVSGNGAADAAQSVDASLRTVSTVVTSRTCGPVAKLPRCHTYHVDALGEDAEGKACALECYWQLGPDSPASRLLADLLEAVLDEPLYDQLRTKEQLGYSVSCGSRWTDGIVGFGISVTSKEAHPDYVAGRVDDFLRKFRKEVMAPSFAEDLVEHGAALALRRGEKHRSPYELADHAWESVADGRPDLFDSHIVEALACGRVAPSAVRAIYDRTFGFGACVPADGATCCAGKLVVRIVGRAATFSEGRGPDVSRTPGCRMACGAAAAGLGVLSGDLVEVWEVLSEFWGTTEECCLAGFDM